MKVALIERLQFRVERSANCLREWLNRRTLPSVANDENLARFILYKNWIRTSDQTVRYPAFLPPPDLRFSVTRHKDLSPQQIRTLGQRVASARKLTLYGRADIQADRVRHLSLIIEPYPLIGNLNHSHITGWPIEKPAQMSLAQQLAAAAKVCKT